MRVRSEKEVEKANDSKDEAGAHQKKEKIESIEQNRTTKRKQSKIKTHQPGTISSNS